MKTFSLKITSPEGDLFSGDAVKLCLRGSEGELAVMAGHIPFATAVLPCECKIELEDENPQHLGILNNIANAILGLEPVYAPAKDGLAGVQLANAMHLSSWLGESVTLPINDELFFEELKKRIAVSKVRAVVNDDKVEAQG